MSLPAAHAKDRHRACFPLGASNAHSPATSSHLPAQLRLLRCLAIVTLLRPPHAPLQVRSSKQDQIHNSIVSTLLALMDGLDARGQVRRWGQLSDGLLAFGRAVCGQACACDINKPMAGASTGLSSGLPTVGSMSCCLRQSSRPTCALPAPTALPASPSLQVVVIGATNRVDALDGALRRPGRCAGQLQARGRSSARRCGRRVVHSELSNVAYTKHPRVFTSCHLAPPSVTPSVAPSSTPPHFPTPPRFDRELVFPLPNLSARADILGIHTRKWAEPPPGELLQELASLAVGYCGADLKVGGKAVPGRVAAIA